MDIGLGLQPYVFEKQRGHRLRMAKLSPHVLLVVDCTADEATALIQPPESPWGRSNLPHFEFVLPTSSANTDDSGAELVSMLAPHLDALASLVTAQLLGGAYRRANPYGQLMAMAASVAAAPNFSFRCGVGSYLRSSSLLSRVCKEARSALSR